MSEQYLCRTIIAPSTSADQYFSFLQHLVNGNWHFYRINLQLFCFVFSIFLNILQLVCAMNSSTLCSSTLVHRTLEWLLSQFSVIEIRFREEKLTAKGKNSMKLSVCTENVIPRSCCWRQPDMHTWCFSCSRWLSTCWITYVVKLLKDKFLVCGLKVLGSEEMV